MNGNILTQTSWKVKSAFTNRLKLSMFVVMALVGLLALTHIAVAAFNGSWGAGELDDVWGSVRVDSLSYDGLETYSRHGFWLSSWVDFKLRYTYEFQHTIRDQFGNALNPPLEDKLSPPTATLPEMGDDSHSPGWRSIYVSNNTLVAGVQYKLHTYSRLEIWKKDHPHIRDNWRAEENMFFFGQ
jgi:hypothetical protein